MSSLTVLLGEGHESSLGNGNSFNVMFLRWELTHLFHFRDVTPISLLSFSGNRYLSHFGVEFNSKLSSCSLHVISQQESSDARRTLWYSRLTRLVSPCVPHKEFSRDGWNNRSPCRKQYTGPQFAVAVFRSRNCINYLIATPHFDRQHHVNISVYILLLHLK